MSIALNKKDRFVVALAITLISITAAVFHFASATVAVLAAIVCSGAILLTALLHVFRRILRHIDEMEWKTNRNRLLHYDQLEAYIALVTSLKPDYPLPSFRDWAASPDLMKLVCQEIGMLKPDLVVETGSGTSTITIGLCLRREGRGKLISFEHDPGYYAETARQINLHNLQDRITLLHRPLEKTLASGEELFWYELSENDIPGEIDLLLVDGPPESTGTHARYPALPLLTKHMGENTVIILDDGGRTGELQTVQRWVAEIPGLEEEYIPLEKGAFRLTVKST